MLQIRRPLCILFCVMTVCCALYFVFFGERTDDPFAGYDKQTVTLAGRVVRKETKRSADGSLTVVWYLRPEGMQGVTIQVYPATDATGTGSGVPAIGKRVRAYGTLRCFREATNPGAFDERRHYRLLGVDCRVTDARITETAGNADPYREGLFLLQRHLAGVIDACFDGTDAGMMKAMLLGDRSALDADLKKLYQRVSLSHLYATSGLHCAAIGMALYALLKRMCLPAYVSAPVCIALMISYGFLCGMPVSAVRAVFMFSLRLFAPLAGRTFDLMSACSLIGILMLAEQPLYVRSAGFLLSFGAIAGIGVLLPALETLFPLPPPFRGEADIFPGGKRARPSVRIVRGIFHALTSGCAVMLATLPVYMCFFYTVPVYSVLLNALAIPLTGILMTAGMAVTCCGMLYVPLGTALSVICRVILWFYRMLCEGGIRLPGHTWYAGSAPVLQVAAYYLLLFVIVLRASGVHTAGARVRGFCILLLAVAVAALSVRHA
ncbi:MAG: ComEC/Rec2 family competence protein, partial [Butyrivibrio sp.]|nr:ComEC/Rec2 family competence protein [Butyrivibrio sp.]